MKGTRKNMCPSHVELFALPVALSVSVSVFVHTHEELYFEIKLKRASSSSYRLALDRDYKLGESKKSEQERRNIEINFNLLSIWLLQQLGRRPSASEALERERESLRSRKRRSEFLTPR